MTPRRRWGAERPPGPFLGVKQGVVAGLPGRERTGERAVAVHRRPSVDFVVEMRQGIRHGVVGARGHDVGSTGADVP